MGEILMTVSREREGEFEKAIEKMDTLVAFRFSTLHPEMCMYIHLMHLHWIGASTTGGS